MYNKSIYATLFPYLKQQQQPVAQGGASMPTDSNGVQQNTMFMPHDPQIQTMGGNAQQPEHANMMSQPVGYTAPQAQVDPFSGSSMQRPQQQPESRSMSVNPMQFPTGDDGQAAAAPALSREDEAKRTVMDFPSTMERPEYDAAALASPGKKPKPTMPEGLSDLEQAEWTAQHGQNEDKGWKGRLKEIVQNFLYGMGQAGPDADWKAALALGGIGAAAGTANRSWNEQRNAQSRIPQLRQKAQFDLEQRKSKSTIANLEAKPGQTQAELDRKVKRDRVEEEYKNNRIALGKEKAEDVRFLQERKLELEERGVDQQDERIRQIDDQIKEKIRSNKAGEGLDAKRIETTSADRARSILANIDKLKPKDATPAQIQAKKDAFLKTLTPEIRQQIGH